MTDDTEMSGHDAWARLKFSIVGRLLAAPPRRGELDAELRELAKQQWRHPITGERTKFGFSTIERWYYAAKRSINPIRALRRKPRQDAGSQTSLKPELIAKLHKQYKAHKRWSYRLHVDNLEALVEKDPTLGPMPSYSTVRRHMKTRGLRPHRGSRRRGPGAERAETRREQVETRSYEVEYVHGLWHFDFHEGSRKVLTRKGEWVTPILVGFIDDLSRLCCHLQWYLVASTETLVHGACQAFQKRGLPRAMMSDQGGQMKAAEFQQGMEDLSIVWDPTQEYSPEQNAKKEHFWTRIEGRLLPMLEGVEQLTLAFLNEATHAWYELEYNQTEHSEIGMPPIRRFLEARSVGRDCPSSDELRRAFRAKAQRKQRRSDGTVSLLGRRYEVPSRFRNVERLCLRYARWDMSTIDVIDERTNNIMCTLRPLDKTKNAEGLRRRREDVSEQPDDVGAADAQGEGDVAPLLRKYMEEYAATGLPPAYLPMDDLEEPTGDDQEAGG